MQSERDEILHRLWTFTANACGDPVFRRQLRYEPRAAFASTGLNWEDRIPSELPIRHYEVSVMFEEALLFGPLQQVDATAPGWLDSFESKLASVRAKPLLLQHGPESTMSSLASRLRRERMTALLSPYEFIPARDSSKGGYSNLAEGVRPAVAGSGSWRTLVAGWEPERVQLAWLCLLFGWDEFLGYLLGYPECCEKMFARLWPEARKNHQGEVVNLLLRRSSRAWVGSFGWETNFFGRYFGLEVTQHFPCNWNCAATVQLSRRNAKILNTFWPEESKSLERLRAPVLYTEHSGVFLFPANRVEEHDGRAILNFDPSAIVSTEPDGELMKLLAGSNGTLTTEEEKIVIGDNSVAGWLLDFGQQPGEALPAVPAVEMQEKLYEILLPPKRRAS